MFGFYIKINKYIFIIFFEKTILNSHNFATLKLKMSILKSFPNFYFIQ